MLIRESRKIGIVNNVAVVQSRPHQADELTTSNLGLLLFHSLAKDGSPLDWPQGVDRGGADGGQMAASAKPTMRSGKTFSLLESLDVLAGLHSKLDLVKRWVVGGKGEQSTGVLAYLIE